MRAILALGLLLCLLGCEEVRSSVSGTVRHSPNFQLSAETEAKSGIRQWFETTYSLHEIRHDGSKRLRWSVVLPEKYRGHRISPTGNVWVWTESVPGPGGGGRIWIRDARANELASWLGSTAVDRERPDEPGQRAEEGSPSFETYAWGAEQLRFSFKNRLEVRYTLLQIPEVGTYAIRTQAQTGERQILEKALAERDYRLLRPQRLIERSPTFYLMRAESLGSGKPELIWILRTQYPHGTASNSWDVLSEHETKEAPVNAQILPSGRIAWFEFGNAHNPTKAELKIFDRSLQPLETIDLVKAGRYESAYRAKNELDLNGLRVLQDGRWLPPQTARFAYDSDDLLELRDSTGKTFRIALSTAKGDFRAKVESYAGEMPLPKEPAFRRSATVMEKLVPSASGDFALRIRRFRHENGKYEGRLTLLAYQRTPDGGRRASEFWSRVAYDPVPDRAFVTNSAKVYYIQTGDTNTERGTKKVAILVCVDPNGRQFGGFDLTSKDWRLEPEQASDGVLVDKMSVVYEGQQGEIHVEGVPVPQWPTERIRIPLSGGKVNAYVVAQSPVPGGITILRYDRS
jgi:hypothetical protein